jgi:predicted protein tyrosine phosphatase
VLLGNEYIPNFGCNNTLSMNILFVCSRNQWRSPTAEAIYKNSSTHSVRSAGTSDSARVRLSQTIVDWAELIFVMEHKHKKRILSQFEVSSDIIVLDIPDEYGYMDEELVEMIKTSVASYIDDK